MKQVVLFLHRHYFERCWKLSRCSQYKFQPIERGIVPKDEGIKEDPRDKSPSRVNGVNDGRVMGRPLDVSLGTLSRYRLSLSEHV